MLKQKTQLNVHVDARPYVEAKDTVERLEGKDTRVEAKDTDERPRGCRLS